MQTEGNDHPGSLGLICGQSRPPVPVGFLDRVIIMNIVFIIFIRIFLGKIKFYNLIAVRIIQW